MDANGLEPKETVPASRKLGRDDAKALIEQTKTLIVAKGKKVSDFNVAKSASEDAIDAMLGPTGNLRAPTIRVGSTLLVGFNEEQYQRVLLG